MRLIFSLVRQKKLRHGRNQAWFLVFSGMTATVYHSRLLQITPPCFPLLLPLQDCANPSMQKESREHIYNTAYTIRSIKRKITISLN